MAELLKLLFKGILTIIMSPIILAYWAICIVVFLFQHLIFELIAIIKFFKGKSITDDDKKTIEMYAYKKKNIERIDPIARSSITFEQVLKESGDRHD